jgi:hypothetical protein
MLEKREIYDAIKEGGSIANYEISTSILFDLRNKLFHTYLHIKIFILAKFHKETRKLHWDQMISNLQNKWISNRDKISNIIYHHD